MTSRQRGLCPVEGERVRIGALLVDLQRSLDVIKAEIKIEEGKAQWSSPDYPRYPTVARAFRTHHDKLAATIRILQDRALEMMGPAG